MEAHPGLREQLLKELTAEMKKVDEKIEKARYKKDSQSTIGAIKAQSQWQREMLKKYS